MTQVIVIEERVTVISAPATAAAIIAVAQQGPTGPTGPQGPAGSSTGVTFNQSTAASTWVVVHNLGYKPAVAVRDSGGSEVEAEVLHINVNETRIYFAAPQTGQAYLI